MPQSDKRFLALLRGINVGGKNIIKKDDLKASFESMGFSGVRTYIQSGNILFNSGEKSIDYLIEIVEDQLAKRFDYDAQAIVISKTRFAQMVNKAPTTWGVDESSKHNALFTLAGIDPKKLLKQLPPPKEEYESVAAGPGIIFWSVSKEFQSRTTMMKLASDPAYQKVTVRNHNTVFKLQKLFDES